MINFQHVKWKNFLSTGNAGNIIYLNKYPTMLIQGASGSGKSTMIDALCFGLFGKPFRKINKPQIINSVNQKHCEVEVAFESNGIQYRVVRGTKPTKFEIYANDKMINQDAALRDYQKVLEQQILSMSFKTFTQVVILGSTAYTPFMELNSNGRREVIEDILDIGIFSVMNQLLKQQSLDTKDQQKDITSIISTMKERAEGLQKLINALSNKQNNELEELKNNVLRIEQEIKIFEEESQSLADENKPLIAEIKQIKPLVAEKNEHLSKISELEYTKESWEQQVEFFKENNECPTCLQHIEDKHKKFTVDKILEKCDDILLSIEQEDKECETKKTRINELAELADQAKKNQQRISSIGVSIEMLERQRGEEIAKIEEKSSASSDVTEAKQELKQVAKDVVGKIETKKVLAEQREIQEAAAQLLRDTGIKTAIIKEYLPIINKFLNKYLNDMELYVDFHLDENFNEVIRSRYRDVFSYGNFSEGEKMRISLAMLFTWRHIARLKNSASCNILILDEILVGRLDQANSDIVINLINQIAGDGTHVFAISHGDALQDKFRGLLTFEKQGDFSVIL